eukprot:TRINITY_DN4720_c0_g1_i1.p2 TRINITY_DN4720_c0_g1~~TRINITY_DN4720_c0_g1_i1.p2  ORF type:complete len:71 (+),score=6.61 TRINITY_DN4720_c0_g1_i1:314-526(+)
MKKKDVRFITFYVPFWTLIISSLIMTLLLWRAYIKLRARIPKSRAQEECAEKFHRWTSPHHRSYAIVQIR